MKKAEAVPDALRELVVSGAEGNPFYVEELIKMLIEDGVIIKGEGRWRIEPNRLTTVRVPPTLTGVLQARLDSLPSEERTVLQQASVVGRRFWDSAVVRINESAKEGIGEKGISKTLSALGGYKSTFKHAVLRDVTYESVLKRLRRVYHALVAEWLIEHSGERVGEYTGLIADHLELAGQTEQAVTYLCKAGEQAAAQFANAEAVAYFSRALDLTPETDTAERYALLLAREKVYDLQGKREAQRQDLSALEELAEALADERRKARVALRQAHFAEVTGDYPAASVAAQEAIGLAQISHADSLEAAGYLQWGVAVSYQGDYKVAQLQLEQAQSMARAAQLRQVEADSLRNLGAVAYYQCDYVGARAFFEQSLCNYREIGDRRGEGRALNSLGLVSMNQGDYARAMTYLEQALRIYGEIGDRRGEGMALLNLGLVSNKQDDYTRASTYLEQALHIKQKVGDRPGEGLALNGLGIASAERGDYTRARACFEQALPILCEIGDRQGENAVLNNLGSVCGEQGDYAGAKAYYEQALLICREIDDRRGEGIALGNLGNISHHLDDDQASREYSQQALLIAQDLGNRPRQGNALTYLGHALAGLGHLTEAADAYRQALALRRELGEHNLTMESLAGLARVSLAQGDLTQAQAHIEGILGHLQSRTPSTGSGHGLDGTKEPFLVYLTCYRVLRANQDPRAGDVLTTAHHLLQERAARISDEELRRSFLENVVAHREIVSEFAKGE